MKEVFVIIVTYKGIRWYDRCFTSLRKSTIPLQTIVVDNASNDGTAEYIRENYPEITLIESKENLGFGKANNIGMRYALDHGCDYVFLLNQDTWIEPQSIEGMIQIHQQNPEYGILSPMHLRGDQKSLYIQIEDGKMDHGNKLLSDCYFNTLDNIYTVTYVNAAAWLLPRRTIETVGGFDPLFVLYGEDDDYLNRNRYHGFKVGLCPKYRIVHDHQESQNHNTNKQYRYYQNRLAFFLDPNHKDILPKYIRRLTIGIIWDCLSLNISRSKQRYKELCFLLPRKKAIHENRIISMISQPSWLQ